MPGRRLWWARCWLGICLSLLGAGGGTTEPCRGARCGGRAGRPARSFLHTAAPLRPPQAKAPPAAPPSRPAAGGAPHPAARGGAPEACPGGDCVANGTRRGCQGLECRLPPRLRPRPRGTGCGAPAEGCPEPALLRAAERAAQFVGDDFAYAAPELGGGALGVQLTCDVKPGAGRPEGTGRGGREGPSPGRREPRVAGHGGAACLAESRCPRASSCLAAVRWAEGLEHPWEPGHEDARRGTPAPLVWGEPGGKSDTGLPGTSGIAVLAPFSTSAALPTHPRGRPIAGETKQNLFLSKR